MLRLYELLRGARGTIICVNKRRLGLRDRSFVTWVILREWLTGHADVQIEKKSRTQLCFTKNNKLRKLAESTSAEEFVNMVVEAVLDKRKL